MDHIIKFMTDITNQRWKVLALITAAVLLVYYPIFQNNFISSYDDGDFFIQWEEVKSLRNIPSLLTGNLPFKHQHVYRPLRSIMQAILYQISSTHPFAYHLFALFIHIASTYLVFSITTVLRDKHTGLIAALFFAVLPVHVESITFITASFDTVGILFALLSFYFYILYRERNRRTFLTASIVIAILGLFTYEITIVLPLLFVLYETLIRKLQKKELLSLFKRLIPFLTATVLFLFIKFALVGQTYFGSFIQHLPLQQRLMNGAKAFVHYIFLEVVNYPLTVFHDMQLSTSFVDIHVLGALLVIAAYIGLVWWLLKKNFRIYAFLMLWFLVTLLPVANIVQIASFVTERYLYLASVSWVILIALFCNGVLASAKATRTVRITTLILCSVVLLSYSGIAWARSKQWKDDVTFWTSTIDHQPDYVGAYINFAFYYTQEKKYDTAVSYLQKALARDPDNALAFGNIGLILMEKKQLNKAIVSFSKAIELDKNNAAFFLNRGFSYHQLGNTESAKKDYRESIRLYPDFYDANFNLAVLYIEAKQYDEAITNFSRAVKLRPKDYESFYGLGMAYAGKRDIAEAREYLMNSLRINPQFTPAKDLLDQL